ncbi:unnamed protein product [Owenia fusiformis]|uniref:Uncharacterized protein n=1 Tax=Owenia fusiformis TaxID=6347 RepID=A0A8J1YAP7_OWEFU|nr:unnamed protein product [Owenia fusiformis]
MLFGVCFIICLCTSGTLLKRSNKEIFREQDTIIETNKKQYDLMEEHLEFKKRKVTWFGQENYDENFIKETLKDGSITGDFVKLHTYVIGDTSEEDVKQQLKNNCDFCKCFRAWGNRIICECHQNRPNKTSTNFTELVSCLPYFTFRLEISGFNFGTIQNGSFSNLPEVKFLLLTECNITILEPDAFRGIKQLVWLRIVDIGKDKEGISFLNYQTLYNCHTIQVLTLGKVKHIENDTFLAVPFLEELTLQHKGILKHYQLFKAFHGLRKLTLNQIKLKRIPDVILSYLVSLKELYLDNNEITSLKFDGNLGPRKKFHLSIQGNNIKSVTKADMSQFMNVTCLELNLADNAIEETEPNFLHDINQIKSLSLERNMKFGKTNLMHLLEGLKGKSIFRLKMTGCGIVIDKFNSSILEPLKNSNLRILSIDDNQINTFEADAFVPVKSLEALQISNFMHISSKTLSPLQNLGILHIHDMFVVYGRLDKANVSFSELKQLRALSLYKLDFDHLIFTFSNDTSSITELNLINLGETFAAYHNQVLNVITKSRLVVLTLSGNLLFRYSDTTLCKLFNGVRTSFIILRDNYFKILPICMFQNFSADRIDLSQNRITYIQEGLFKNIKNKITLLNLTGNAISLIDGTALAKVARISIENNLIECNCATQPFMNWLKRRKNSSETRVTHDRFCASSTGPTHNELLTFELTWVQCNMNAFVRIISLSISSVILVGVITASLLKYFWKDIKYMQLVRRAKRHNGYIQIGDQNGIQNDILNDDVIQDNEIYDAFISYHSEKRIWVRDVMTPELTNGDVQFSLIHDDNIIPGQESYFGGLMSHMDRSRHIIFLVTRGWMKEGWNEFEMDSAIDMLTQTKRHTLIVILMEHIPQKDMSHKLKLMVRHNVCLKWSEEEGNQRKFWRDLKLELGKKRYE